LYKNKKILGIILARSGSKRLPDKNVLNFCGKPLFYWTILACKKSRYLDSIVISTDHKKIIKYTKKLSYIKTAIRPKKLAGDKIKSEKVVIDLIKKIKEKFDIIVLLQVTSPLRKKFHIDKAIKRMIDKDEKFMVSASYRNFYTKNMIEVQKGYFQKRIKRSSGHSINGAIYLAKTPFFKKSRSFLTKNTKIFLMPASRSIDIDTMEDFKLAKIKFKNKKI